MRTMLMLAALAFGCGGDDEMQTMADANQNLPACTGGAYDPCTDTVNHSDCGAGMTCRLFMQQGYTICTPACDATTPCPADKDGNPVTCNMMGRCRAEPTACTP